MRALRLGLVGLSLCGCTPAATAPAPVRPRPIPERVNAERAPAPKEEATLALASTLLAEAKGREGAERTALLERVFKVLEAATGKAGRAAIVRPTPLGEPLLLPDGRHVEVAALGDAGLRIAGKGLHQVGPRVLSLVKGQVTLHQPDATELDEQFDSIDVPPRADRYVLARRGDRAFVLDAETGKTVLETGAKGAQLLYQTDGTVRLFGADGGKATLRDVPTGKVVIELAGREALVALDPLAKRMAIWTMVSPRNGSVDNLQVFERIAVLDTVDGQEVGSVRVPAVMGARGTFSRDGKRLALSHVSGTPGTVFDFALLDIAAGTYRRIGSSKTFERGAVAFTADGKHVCADPPAAPVPAARVPAGRVAQCLTFRAADGHDDAVIVSYAPQAGWRLVASDGTAEIAPAVQLDPRGRRAVFVLARAAGPQSVLNPVSMQAVVVDATGKDEDFVIPLGSLAPLQVDVRFSLDGRYLDTNIGLIDLEERGLVTRHPRNITPSPVAAGYKLGTDSDSSVVLVTPAGETSTIVFWDISVSAALLDDGRFDPMTSRPGDMACAFGDILAPIEVCPAKLRLPEGTVIGWLKESNP